MPSILKVGEAHDLEQSKVHAGRAAQEHVQVGVVGRIRRDAGATAEGQPRQVIFSTGGSTASMRFNTLSKASTSSMSSSPQDDPAVGKVGDGLELL